MTETPTSPSVDGETILHLTEELRVSASSGLDMARTMNRVAYSLQALTRPAPSSPALDPAKIKHKGVFIERQGDGFICHTGIAKYLPDLYPTQAQAIAAVNAKQSPALDPVTVEALTDFLCETQDRIGPGCDETAIAQALVRKYPALIGQPAPSSTVGELLDEIIVTMRHARTFITSREKMHPTGIELYDDLLGRLTGIQQGKTP